MRGFTRGIVVAGLGGVAALACFAPVQRPGARSRVLSPPRTGALQWLGPRPFGYRQSDAAGLVKRPRWAAKTTRSRRKLADREGDGDIRSTAGYVMRI